MLLKSMTLKNFRMFKSQEFRFTPGMNVFLGDNGTGKSTILEAARIAIGSWFLGFDDLKAANISRTDAHLVFNDRFEEYTYEPLWPCSVQARGTVLGQAMEWARTKSSKTGRTDRRKAREIYLLSGEVQEKIKQDDLVDLPVLAYYSSGRLWLASRKSAKEISTPSRLFGYKQCLLASNDHHGFLQLWKRRELIGLQRRKRLPQLEVVRRAVIQATPKAKNIFYDLNYDDLVVEFEDQKPVPFKNLSDGYRSVIAMVADIAGRASMLNPHRGEHAAQNAKGVVLIDEIGLHLHPSWQRRILKDLRTIFPKIQFIVTTHAPQVLVGARDGEIQIVSRKDKPEQEDIPLGFDANKVLTGAWFKLISTLEEETLNDLYRHQSLLRQASLTKQEMDEKTKLEQILRQRLGHFHETSLERMTDRIIAEITEELKPDTPENRDRIREKAKAQLRAKLGKDYA